MAAITIEGVSKRFGAAMALEQLDLTVADGEFVALLGPSGCGKTTLLRIIAGLETRSSGRVLIGDRDVSDLPPAQRGLAMVFQNYAVFPHLTVFENVAFGLRMQKRDEAAINRQVKRAADLLQIGPYLDRYPAKLSGGQRQRVAVARALAVEPAVLLMDGLDIKAAGAHLPQSINYLPLSIGGALMAIFAVNQMALAVRPADAVAEGDR